MKLVKRKYRKLGVCDVVRCKYQSCHPMGDGWWTPYGGDVYLCPLHGPDVIEIEGWLQSEPPGG